MLGVLPALPVVPGIPPASDMYYSSPSQPVSFWVQFAAIEYVAAVVVSFGFGPGVRLGDLPVIGRFILGFGFVVLPAARDRPRGDRCRTGRRHGQPGRGRVELADHRGLRDDVLRPAAPGPGRPGRANARPVRTPLARVIAIGALFLLAPLVVVPLGLRLIEPDGSFANRVHRMATLGSWPAGAALGLAMALPAGALAAALAVAWLGIATLRAVAAAAERVTEVRATRRDAAWIDAVAAAFLVVGATWIVADRLGIRPMGFDPTVVRLTAVHFHFAGFGLLLVAGRLAERLGGVTPRLAGALTGIGVPLVALGFMGLPVAGMVGVVTVAAAGLVVGVLQVRVAGSMGSFAARGLARLGGLSLFVTMPMAILWQIGLLMPVAWIDLAAMVRIHGVLNALGFGVASTMAWTLDRVSVRTTVPINVAAR